MDLEQTTEAPREGKDLEQVGAEIAGQEVPQENATPAESSTGANENGSQPSQGGATNTPTESTAPFNEHPRWQEMQRELAETRRRADEMAGQLQQIPGYLDQMRQQLTSRDAPVPDWFKELYGDSPKAWGLYQQREAQQYQQMQQSIMQGIQAQQQEQAQVATYWANQVSNEFTKLEQSGKKFDRKELEAVLLNYKPVGEDGLLDFNKAYDILEYQKKAAQVAAQGQQRKKIADATSPTPSGDAPAKDYVTTAEIRGKNWGSL